MTASARKKGGEAGNLALARAERAEPEWSDAVLHMLRWYGKIHDKPFTAEDFLQWALARGLPEPTDRRATGPLIAKAIRDGLIVKVGYAPTVSSRGSARATYRRAV
jgi:hypothetical protein